MSKSMKKKKKNTKKNIAVKPVKKEDKKTTSDVLRPATKLQMLRETEGEEEWREVDLDPTIKVSSWGRVKRHGKLTNLGEDRDGYKRITIKGKSYRLHRIILNAFIPCPGDKYVIDHINNIHNDNRISNLRWVTIQENSKFAGEMGLQSRKINSNQIVICIDESTGIGYMFATIVDLCKYFTKLKPDDVYAYMVGKRKTLKGYKVVRVEGLEDKRDRNR